MATSGQASARRAANAKAFSAFGIVASTGESSSLYKEIRSGSSTTLFTIGYERRTGEDLLAALRDAGVEHLADVRDKPISRKPDFRAAALQRACEEAGIEYGAWPELGSIEAHRDHLHETGDLARFHRVFRAYAERSLDDPIGRLAKLSKRKSVALMCYERAHEECHRSTIADLIADRLRCTVVAIL